MHKIFSITVTYNPCLDVLEKQFDSLKKENLSILVVDNGSDNQIGIETLCIRYNAVIIKLDDNKGLAFAQNAGVEKSITLGANYFILFDQDSVVDEGFVDCLYSSYYSLKSNGINVAAVGPTFYDPGDRNLYPPTRYIGPFIKKISREEMATKVTFLIASGSFIPVKNYELIGAFTNDLFVDYIDVEWSLRCQREGYDVYMSNSALMAHTIGDKRKNILGRTISVHSPIRRYYLIRNSFYMLRLPYVPIGYKIREIFFNLLRCLVAIIYSNNRIDTIKFIFRGLKDGVLGRFGKGI